MAEGDEVVGGIHELVLQALAFAPAHLLEPERVEHLRVRVLRVVVVHRPRGRDEHRALRDERPVVQRDVLHGLARQADCGTDTSRVRFTLTGGPARRAEDGTN